MQMKEQYTSHSTVSSGKNLPQGQSKGNWAKLVHSFSQRLREEFKKQKRKIRRVVEEETDILQSIKAQWESCVEESMV